MSKLSTQHKWLLAGIGIVLVNVAVWFFGLSPALDRVEAVRAEYSTVEQQKAGLERRLEELNAIDAEQLQEEMEDLNLRVPEFGMLQEYLVELEEVAGNLSLELDTISALPVKDEGSYLFLDTSVALKGSYSNLYAYLEFLENHERLLLVRSFGFSGDNDNISTSMLVTIFAEDFTEHTPYQAPGKNHPFAEQ